MTMKGGKDKAMKPEQGKQKAPPARAVLVCKSSCNIPGIGTWTHGDIVRDPALIEKIQGSPNFERTQEVE